MMVAIGVGVPLGLVAGLNPESRPARVIMAGTVLGYSLPSFWKGMMLILLFAVALGWLPTAGRGETIALAGVSVSFLTANGLKHLVLPVINLAVFQIALIARLVAAGATEAMQQDYVKYARAKGVRRQRIIGRHVLRNILIPVVTVIGIGIALLIGGVVVTESVYSIPGLGTLTVDAVLARDFPVIQGVILFFAFLYVMVNLLVDLSYLFLDPRIRY